MYFFAASEWTVCTMSESSSNEPETREEHTPRAIFQNHLDEHDYRIFRALNEDGRMSDTDIAERVGLSRTAVRRRREKLQKEGIFDILAVIVLQEANLAYADVRIVFAQDAPLTERNALIDTLIDDELIYSIDSCMGEFDLFIRIWHSSLDEIQSYLWQLFEDEAIVAEYKTTPVTKTWKAWDKELDRPTL
jgi:Lrp/AsnC family leucine-responsive transcriptional regulator